MIAQHSATTPEHYTPQDIIEAAHHTMGGIDLDPATTESVNAKRVLADRFYTKETNGLAHPWFGRVWLNPPGGRVGNKSSAAIWWSKLAEEYGAGRVEQAIFLGFTLEILSTAQDACIWPGAMPFCIPRRRIEFLQELNGEFVKGESPTHANVIAYLPPRYGGLAKHAALARFADEFSKFGRVRT